MTSSSSSTSNPLNDSLETIKTLLADNQKFFPLQESTQPVATAVNALVLEILQHPVLAANAHVLDDAKKKEIAHTAQLVGAELTLTKNGKVVPGHVFGFKKQLTAIKTQLASLQTVQQINRNLSWAEIDAHTQQLDDLFKGYEQELLLAQQVKQTLPATAAFTATTATAASVPSPSPSASPNSPFNPNPFSPSRSRSRSRSPKHNPLAARLFSRSRSPVRSSPVHSSQFTLQWRTLLDLFPHDQGKAVSDFLMKQSHTLSDREAATVFYDLSNYDRSKFSADVMGNFFKNQHSILEQIARRVFQSLQDRKTINPTDTQGATSFVRAFAVCQIQNNNLAKTISNVYAKNINKLLQKYTNRKEDPRPINQRLEEYREFQGAYSPYFNERLIVLDSKQLIVLQKEKAQTLKPATAVQPKTTVAEAKTGPKKAVLLKELNGAEARFTPQRIPRKQTAVTNGK